MVNHIFDFARNEANFDASALSRDDFENAYLNLNIYVEYIYIDEAWNLDVVTKKRLV